MRTSQSTEMYCEILFSEADPHMLPGHAQKVQEQQGWDSMGQGK